MGQKQKRIRPEKSNRTRQKNKRGDAEKWDQTGIPEFPDKGEASEIPGLPSGGSETGSVLAERVKTVKRQRRTQSSTHVLQLCKGLEARVQLPRDARDG